MVFVRAVAIMSALSLYLSFQNADASCRLFKEDRLSDADIHTMLNEAEDSERELLEQGQNVLDALALRIELRRAQREGSEYDAKHEASEWVRHTIIKHFGQAVAILLFTNSGERVFEPETYGVVHTDIAFVPSTTVAEMANLRLERSRLSDVIVKTLSADRFISTNIKTNADDLLQTLVPTFNVSFEILKLSAQDPMFAHRSEFTELRQTLIQTFSELSDWIWDNGSIATAMVFNSLDVQRSLARLIRFDVGNDHYIPLGFLAELRAEISSLLINIDYGPNQTMPLAYQKAFRDVNQRGQLLDGIEEPSGFGTLRDSETIRVALMGIL